MFDPDNINPSEHIPEDPRLNPYKLVERWQEYVSDNDLEALVDPNRQQWSESLGLATLAIPVGPDSTEVLSSFFENANNNCVRKKKWPKDEWRKGPGVGLECTRNLVERCSFLPALGMVPI